MAARPPHWAQKTYLKGRVGEHSCPCWFAAAARLRPGPSCGRQGPRLLPPRTGEPEAASKAAELELRLALWEAGDLSQLCSTHPNIQYFEGKEKVIVSSGTKRPTR